MAQSIRMIRFLLELTANNPVFAIEPMTGLRLAALTQQVLNREIPLNAGDFGKEKLLNADYDVTVPATKSAPSTTSRVRVIPIHGVMTMHGGMCSYGMIDYGNMIASADKNPDISAIVLDVSSPGGEASYSETLAQIVSETQKPVVVWANQMVCSAAYYFASAADEILLAGKTTDVGSIGTLIHYLDFTRKFNAEGIDEVMILASKSTAKRKYNFSNPTDEDRQLIVEGLLDPHNSVFLSDVARYRPGMEDQVFTGEVFMGDDAIRVGLADGYATRDEALVRAATLAKNQKSNSSQMKMKETAGLLHAMSESITRLQQRLSGSPEITAVEEAPVDAPVDTPSPEQLELSQLRTENEALRNQIADQDHEMSQIRTQVSTLQAELQQIGQKLSATPTLPGSSDDLVVKTQKRAMLPETEEAIRHFQATGLIK